MLKNGNRVEGSVLSENANGVRIKYRLTPKIFDEKTFPAAEVVKVIRQTPQELELIELKKLLPTPDLMDMAKYDALIQEQLRPFQLKYPGSAESEDAEKLISTLLEEKTMIRNGQIKHEGRWLTAREARAEKFHIEAFQIVQSMRAKAAKGDLQGALRDYDRLYNPSPAYKGSIHSLNALSEALEITRKWLSMLEKLSREQPELLRIRNDMVAKLKEPERSRTKNAIDDEMAKWRAAYDVERRQRLRWNLPYKFDAVSIQYAQREAVEEITRLETLNLAEIQPWVELISQCYRKIGEGDYLGGASLFEKISSSALPLDYRDIPSELRLRLLALHTELSRTYANPASTQAAAPAAPAVSVDERVAQILAESKVAAASAAASPAASPAAPAAHAASAASRAAASAASAAARAASHASRAASHAAARAARNSSSVAFPAEYRSATSSAASERGSVSRSPVLRPSASGVFLAHQTANKRIVRSSCRWSIASLIHNSHSALGQFSQTSAIVGWVRAQLRPSAQALVASQNSAGVSLNRLTAAPPFGRRRCWL